MTDKNTQKEMELMRKIREYTIHIHEKLQDVQERIVADLISVHDCDVNDIVFERLADCLKPENKTRIIVKGFVTYETKVEHSSDFKMSWITATPIEE